MPSRNVIIQPYELPGGAATTEVAVSLELVDSDGATQLGYAALVGDGVAGGYTATVRDIAVVIPLQLTTELVPPLYWRFKAQWRSLSGPRSYTSGYIALAAGGDLSLPEFLALEETPATITGLTADEVAAIRGANAPSANNPLATLSDLVATGNFSLPEAPLADGPYGRNAGSWVQVMGSLIYDPAGVRANCFNLANLSGNLDGGTFS